MLWRKQKIPPERDLYKRFYLTSLLQQLSQEQQF
jgi:hypothetical protein